MYCLLSLITLIRWNRTLVDTVIKNSDYIKDMECNYQLVSRLDTSLYRDKAVCMCYWQTAILISSCLPRTLIRLCGFS